MKKIEIEVSEKMYAAIEGIKKLWEYKNIKSTAEELLKGSIEHQIMLAEQKFPEDYKIIEEIMESKGFVINIYDMDVYKYPFKDRRY